jgi:O-antigen/teichoic acid export membrane protein
MADGDQAIRDVVKGAGVVYIGLFLELLIAFVAQVLAARYLSVGDFGGLTAGTALLDIGAIVAGLGFASGLIRYFPRIEPGKRRSLATITVAVTLVTSTVLGAIIAFNAGPIAVEIFGNPNVETSIRIFGAAIPFSTVLNVAVGGIRGQEQSVYWVIVKNFIQPISRIALVTIAVLYGLGQAGIAGAYAVPYAVSALVALLLLYWTLPASSTPVDFSLLNAVTRYSLPFTVTGISNFVYRSIDIFLVLYFLGDVSTGIYGVAYAAVAFMDIPSTAFNFLGAPVASRLESGGEVDYIIQLFRATARWLIIGSVCLLIPLGVFSTEFITVIYQSRYAEGGIVLAILAVGFAIKNVLSIHNPILEALGMSKTLSFNNAVAAAANIVLNVALIPALGIVGAAVATVCSFVLRDGLAMIQVYMTLKTVPLAWRELRPLLLGVPFLAIMLVFISSLIPVTFLWLVAASGLAASLYVAGVILLFGLSDTDAMLLRSGIEQYGPDSQLLDELITRLSK